MSLKFLFSKEINSSNPQPNSQEDKNTMCNTFNGHNYDRATTLADVKKISAFYSETLANGWVEAIFEAMSSHGSFVKPIALAFVCELVRGKQTGMGIKNFGFFIPFSGMSMDGGLIRYQTPIITEVHNAWLSFTMGQWSKKTLTSLLHTYDIELLELHDCGCISTDPALSQTEDFSKLYEAINHFRSYGETRGTAVVQIDCFDDYTTDMTKDALEAYSRIEQLMQTLPDKPNFQIPTSVLEAQETVRELFSVPAFV